MSAVLHQTITGLFANCDQDLPSLLDDSQGIFTDTANLLTGVTLSADARSLIDTLQKMYNFDILCSGYGFKCLYRQNTSSVLGYTIPWKDLVMGSEKSLISITTEMGTQLPQDYIVRFPDLNREFAQSAAPSTFPQVDSGDVQTFESPVVMTFDRAQTLANFLRKNSWVQSSTVKFVLPYKSATFETSDYQRLEPSDVISVETVQGDVLTVMIKALDDTNGKLEIEAAIAGYAHSLGDNTPAVPSVTAITFSQPSHGLFLDIPMLSSTTDTSGMLWATCPADATSPWEGCDLYKEDISGDYVLSGYTNIDTLIGTCGTALGAHDGNLIDLGNILTVTPAQNLFDLFSVTKEQMLTGANTAAYGSDGRWEIIRYQTATLNLDGTYTLSGLLRGLFGTEQYTGTHSTGDTFVALEQDALTALAFTVSDIGISHNYKFVTVHIDIADTTAQTGVKYNAVNLKPLSGCKAVGTRSGGDLTATWVRRSRTDGEWRNGTDCAIGESSESYSVDVMSGATAVRTLSTTSPTFTYSSADQTTDFGSPQSSITFRIYQISATIGRGYPYEVTL